MTRSVSLLAGTACYFLACDRAAPPPSPKGSSPVPAPAPASPPVPPENSLAWAEKPQGILLYGIPECDFRRSTRETLPPTGKPFLVRIHFQNRLTRKKLFPHVVFPLLNKERVEVLKMSTLKDDLYEINEIGFLDVLLKINKKESSAVFVVFTSSPERPILEHPIVPQLAYENPNAVGAWVFDMYSTLEEYDSKHFPLNEETLPEKAALRRLFRLPVSGRLNRIEQEGFLANGRSGMGLRSIPDWYNRELPLPEWWDAQRGALKAPKK